MTRTPEGEEAAHAAVEPVLHDRPAWPSALRSRSLRIWSGGVLGVFLLGHLSNIALGLVSVRSMDRMSGVLGLAWHSVPGTAALLGALVVHFGLSLRALSGRRTLRMTPREGLQTGFGLLLPFLVVPHVVGARVAPDLTGVPMTYAVQLRQFWVTEPGLGARQALALSIAWAHGCFGFWFALRSRAWFERWTWLLYPLAVLVPVLALLGFAEAGRAVAMRGAAAARRGPALDPALAGAVVGWVYAALGGPLAWVLLLRGARRWRGGGRIRVLFPDGRSVSVPRGSSILEASRIGGRPHASLCGGRGRCSTCRVRVTSGFESLPPPSSLEAATLLRSGAQDDHRLACQLRPTADLAVMPIFAPTRGRSAPMARRLPSASHERELAVLFCDLRGFTRRAERWLPFDTVFLLNRYFEAFGEAIEAAGGHLDKFIGDGALALFGLGTGPDDACRRALAAAAGVARGVAALNAELAAEIGEPLRIAMGLHVGPAVVGDMGYGDAVAMTAVGDGINVASRLEGEAKERDVEAVVSMALLARAGWDASRTPLHRIGVRGRIEPVEVAVFADASNLWPAPPAATAVKRPASPPRARR